MTNVIFIHGNGGSTSQDNWFPSAAKQLQDAGLTVINKTFPDNEVARASVWLPYLTKLGANANTILVGHSSGALAAMRYAESHQILGSVLVAAACTDLGDENEKASGYFDTPWDWSAIKYNQKWIIQFASADDPYIPASEAYEIMNKLGTNYREYLNRGHFSDQTSFPDLVKAIIKKLKTQSE